ncbi:MAG: tRNA (N(6)-L-threonylcarbamoyladenosine(37)-C(2))-methylthiotransferase MtaB [Waddliaceae bacterium]
MNNSKNKTFRIATLGCRTNQYESQAYRDLLEQKGWIPAADGEVADICLVNTCTVTDSADRSSRREIRRLAQQNPGSRLVVTGCSVEQQPEQILQIPGVTDLVANKDKEQLLAQIFPTEHFPEFSIRHFDAHTRAFVKIQDGCNSFCTYCIIPYVRGRSRSRTVDDVVKEVEELIAHGYKEVVLTGINIGDFDGNPPKGEPSDKLSDLIKAVDRIPGLERLRISSIDPDEVDQELIEAILNGRSTCPSMHLVLQSGSNVILKRMNRKYTRQIFLQTVERLQAACSDFTFTTDVIVGFPGETKADFAETLAVLERVKFAKVHMFPFSPRPRTRAALYSDQVPPEVMRERKQKVMQMSERMAYELREGYLFRRLNVLTEKRESAHAEEITGHTENFLNVKIQNTDVGPNQMVEVECTHNTPTGLIGNIVGDIPEQAQKLAFGQRESSRD